MTESVVTQEDRDLARKCLNCPVCSRARRKQRGICYWFVKHVENGRCPACGALEKVMGTKAHEPLPDDWEERMKPNSGAQEPPAAS